MFSLKKAKKMIHIVIEDYVIRIVETNGRTLTSAKLVAEKALPFGLIDNGKITDEIVFYEFMQDLVRDYQLKNRVTRFMVPNSLVIMRHIEIPTNLVEKKKILEHIEMEIGDTIHLPFSDPVFDVTYAEEEIANAESIEKKQVILFAAPGEEMRKYTETFVDASLKPIAADIGILGDYRYFHHTYEVQEDRVYLLAEFNRNSVYLGIFKGHQLQFLRYQDLDVDLKSRHDETEVTWVYGEGDDVIRQLMADQVEELGRIMNFYRFSMRQGEEVVTDIVLLGDYPELGAIYHQIVERHQIPTVRLKTRDSLGTTEEEQTAFIPVLGLALKGGRTDDASRS